MREKSQEPKSYVIGPEGDVLTVDNLPSADTIRWVPRKKGELVMAVRGGLLSFGEACERYQITPEELLSWHDAMDHFGLEGLWATFSRDHRQRLNALSVSDNHGTRLGELPRRRLRAHR